MNETQTKRLSVPNAAVKNAAMSFFKIHLLKNHNLEYAIPLTNPILARQIYNVIKDQVKLCDNANNSTIYSEDFCTTIDNLFEEQFKEKL